MAVLGVGGLGGSAALWLASVGIGEMWLIDGDRIEPSNLNRQVLFGEAEIGQLKVEVAARRLREFNPALRVTTEARRLESEEDIAKFIAGSDVVVDAADWPAHDIERWCNAACFAAGIPYITMSHFPPVARVGPALRPRQDRLLRLPGDRLPAPVPALRRRGRRAPCESLAGGDAWPGLRHDRWAGGA